MSDALMLILFCLGLFAYSIRAEAEASPQEIKSMVQAGKLEMADLAAIGYVRHGIPDDTRFAVGIFAQTAIRGSASGMQLVGSSFEEGALGLKDLNRAKEYFVQAAKWGDEISRIHLEELMLADAGTNDAQVDKSVKIIQEDARHGLARAEFVFGTLFEDGIGVKKDLTQALEWLDLAVLHGSKDAVERQAEIELLIDPSQKSIVKKFVSEFAPDTNSLQKISFGDECETMSCGLGSDFEVAVSLCGETNWFTLDTGTDYILLNNRFPEKIGGILIQDKLVLPEVELGLSTCPPLFVGNRVFHPLFAHISSDKFSTGSRSCLGMNCLREYVASIDYDNKTLSLAHKVDRQVLDHVSAVTLNRYTVYTYTINAKISTNNIPLFVDSGNTSTISLNKADFESCFGLKATVLQISGKTEAGPFIAGLVRVPQIVIGDITYTNLIATIIPFGPSAIGSRFLQRHLSVFDFPNKQVYFVPGKHCFDPDDIGTTGIVLAADGTRLLVDNIISGSPADLTGIKEGDQIIEIENRKVKAADISLANEMLEPKDGQRVSLKVLRKGESHSFQFIAKTLL